MKVSIVYVFTSGLAGVFLGLVLAPPPPPVVERVPIYTADVLDTGTVCIYTWDDGVYAWKRAHVGLGAEKPCPEKAEAQRRWREATLAPVVVVRESER